MSRPPTFQNLIALSCAFLKLGLTAFGGPIAHIGYFRNAFVIERHWLTETQFAQLLAVCQSLPGPTSSQLGFSIGLLHAGWLGAFLAFMAFTLPSALIMIGFASTYSLLTGTIGLTVIHSLKLVACVVVIHAVIGMARQLCKDNITKFIALWSFAMMLIQPMPSMQFIIILLAACSGAFFLLNTSHCGDSFKTLPLSYSRMTGGICFGLFLMLLMTLPILAKGNQVFVIANAFYQAGALVFGGGHVVLPLLQASIVETGWITNETFLAGYGASQAIPGPMFTLSAYLGATIADEQHMWLIASTALGFIFLPGFLLVLGVLPFWQTLAHYPLAMRAIAGINSAVVGILGAALYNPLLTSSMNNLLDLIIIMIGLWILYKIKQSPIMVIVWCLFANIAFALWQ